MAFRLYFDININETDTQIYNNDHIDPVFDQDESTKIVIVGINTDFKSTHLTITDSTNQYVELKLPVYEIATPTNRQYDGDDLLTYNRHDFITLDLNKDRKANLAAFKKSLMTMGADYILIYINDLDGSSVEKSLIHYLEEVGSTKLSGRTSGSWCIFLKTISVQRFINKHFEVVAEETADSGDSIELYYLTHTELTNLNKKTWNELFQSDYDETTIQTYYQNLLDTLDDIIYDDDSDYVQIMSRIHHHLVHPRDDNLDGVISELDMEKPYYDIYPDQLPTDMSLITTDTHTLKYSMDEAGLEFFAALSKKILAKSSKASSFLTNQMIELMVEIRNLYIATRTELDQKLDLSLS